MTTSVAQQLHAIDWTRYQTRFGSAERVPAQLVRLSSDDTAEAFEAAHQLWCGLCFAYAGVASAALPALPFLVEALEGAGPRLGGEILDILLGCALGTVPDSSAPLADWQEQLREQLRLELPRLVGLAGHSSDTALELVQQLVDALAN